MENSSPTRNQTWAVCIGSSESELLDNYGRPHKGFLNMEEGGQRVRTQSWHHEKDSTAIAGFEDGRGPASQEMQADSGTWKRQGNDFSSEPPEGTQFY